MVVHTIGTLIDTSVLKGKKPYIQYLLLVENKEHMNI